MERFREQKVTRLYHFTRSLHNLLLAGEAARYCLPCVVHSSFVWGTVEWRTRSTWWKAYGSAQNFCIAEDSLRQAVTNTQVCEQSVALNNLEAHGCFVDFHCRFCSFFQIVDGFSTWRRPRTQKSSAAYLAMLTRYLEAWHMVGHSTSKLQYSIYRLDNFLPPIMCLVSVVLVAQNTGRGHQVRGGAVQQDSHHPGPGSSADDLPWIQQLLRQNKGGWTTHTSFIPCSFRA